MTKAFSVWTGISVFVSMAILDVIWGIYLEKMGEKKPAQAATVAAAMWLFGAYAVVSYTSNHWYVAFAFAGAWIGTYAISAYQKRKAEK